MKLKVAVIGAGAMGKNHARVYSEMKNVELVAVCDSSKEVGGQIARFTAQNTILITKICLQREA